MGAICKRAHDRSRAVLSVLGLWLYARTFSGCEDPQFVKGDKPREEQADEPETSLDADVIVPPDAPVADASVDARQDAASGEAARLDGALSPASRDASGDAQSTMVSGPGAAHEAGPSAGDARVSDQGEAGPPSPLDGAPPWVSELPGRYAIDMVWFSDDNVFVMRTHEVMLAEIARAESGLTMTVQQCEWVVTNRLGSIRMSKPEAIPRRRFNVLWQSDTFRMEPIDVAIGYDATPPSECAGRPGALVQKRPFQSWLPGESCRCPMGALPLVDDCRVLDVDGDGRPGYSIDGDLVNGDWTFYAATERRSVIVNGRPSTGGSFTAQLEGNESSRQLGATPSGADDLSGTVMACLPRFNRVTFTALDRRIRPEGDWTCATVLSQRAELFPMAPPSTPARGTCK